MDRTDMTLTCCDCGHEFSWTKSEQDYYWSRELSQPKRCLTCRRRRRERIIKDEGVNEYGDTSLYSK